MADQPPVRSDHPDYYALEYIDAKIAQYKLRSIDPARQLVEREHFHTTAMAFGVLRGDIFTMLHRPDPVIVTVCDHAGSEVMDVSPALGDVWRCRRCQEVRPRVRETDVGKMD